MLGQSAPEATLMGQLGMEIVQDALNHPNLDVGIIEALQDTVIASMTSGKKGDGATNVVTGTLAAVTLKAGCQLRGRFTQIQLTSGGVALYKL